MKRESKIFVFLPQTNPVMKKVAYFLLMALILSSCASSSKLLQRGQYDAAINKSVKKLRKNPGKEKEAINLDRAYKVVNERELERVKFLKQEGNPNNWNEVFAVYSRLKNRQTMVRTVTPLTIYGQSVDYPYVDYDAEIIAAKENAAEYFYTNGQKLMELGTREGYRQAYEELSLAAEYSGGQFPGLDEMMEEARYKGISRVIVGVNNMTHLKLDPMFEENLLEINTDRLGSEWVEYHFKHLDDDINYDYTVWVNLENIISSPDEVKESDKMYKKEIQDGFDYVLDANGNVMKDTAGNDIKIPKYKTLSCTVIETHQFKSVRVNGNVEIISNYPKKLIKKEPIGAENVFDHHSARAVGDIDALEKEQLEMIEREFIPFPSDVEMIINTVETLKPAIQDALFRNRRFIQ
jgi:hypothetical protein